MLEDYKSGQPIVYQVLKNTVAKDRLTHAYLFETNGFSKTRDVALAFAKYLLCPNNYANCLNCVNCTQCKTIDDGNFPEIKIIEPDGQWIKKEQLEELQKEFSKKAIVGNHKIYIIDGADKLNASASNSILKFLEEPEENIIAILLVDNLYQLLDTIVSRCQVISFKKDYLETLLEEYNNYPSTLVHLASILSSTQEQIVQFLEDSKNAERIEAVHTFIQYHELHHLKTLLHTQKLFHAHFPDKESVAFAFELILLYYKDVLNQKSGKELEVFHDYAEGISKVAQKNTLLSLYHKLDTVMNLKYKLKVNVNINLLIDKLVMALEEGVKHD